MLETDEQPLRQESILEPLSSILSAQPLTISRVFMDKRMSQVVPLDSLGDEWAGYEAKITGGNDKQGFP